MQTVPDPKWIWSKTTLKNWSDNFSTNVQFKNINSFLSKKYSRKKLAYLVKISNLTHLQDGNTKVKFMSRILEKIHVGSEKGSGSETNWKVESGSEKNHSGSMTLLHRKPSTKAREYLHRLGMATFLRTVMRTFSHDGIFWPSLLRVRELAIHLPPSYLYSPICPLLPGVTYADSPLLVKGGGGRHPVW